MNTAIAGTLESMDCMVTVTEKSAGAGVSIELEGSSVKRFHTIMKKTILQTLKELGVNDIDVKVNDHGALDVVLAARVETAVRRMRGEK